MLNKLLSFIRKYDMIRSGDEVICAVSGGADSIALLFAMYLLAPKLGVTLTAAHFNHCLRGQESDRDEAFVQAFCDRYEIKLYLERGQVKPGKKGLEAAARDARYTFLKQLPGKIATAHTADDNAETVIMRLVRGSGLKGLGAIAPVTGCLIRPMLGITRQEVLSFLEEYHLDYITDSSNNTDQFQRNRIRHHVMPQLEKENPKVAENLSAMAMRLREDASFLDQCAADSKTGNITKLRDMPGPIRSRVLGLLLEQWGIREPEAEHIALLEKLVYSDNPSAKASFPGNVTITRRYDRLEVLSTLQPLETAKLSCPCVLELGDQKLRVICSEATQLSNSAACFTVVPHGQMVLRHRQSGDTIRLSGGTKELKELYIDRKIPAAQRLSIPVIADDKGVLGVCGIGANQMRLAQTLPAIEIRFEIIE